MHQRQGFDELSPNGLGRGPEGWPKPVRPEPVEG